VGSGSAVSVVGLKWIRNSRAVSASLVVGKQHLGSSTSLLMPMHDYPLLRSARTCRWSVAEGSVVGWRRRSLTMADQLGSLAPGEFRASPAGVPSKPACGAKGIGVLGSMSVSDSAGAAGASVGVHERS